MSNLIPRYPLITFFLPYVYMHVGVYVDAHTYMNMYMYVSNVYVRVSFYLTILSFYC